MQSQLKYSGGSCFIELWSYFKRRASRSSLTSLESTWVQITNSPSQGEHPIHQCIIYGNVYIVYVTYGSITPFPPYFSSLTSVSRRASHSLMYMSPMDQSETSLKTEHSFHHESLLEITFPLWLFSLKDKVQAHCSYSLMCMSPMDQSYLETSSWKTFENYISFRDFYYT